MASRFSLVGRRKRGAHAAARLELSALNRRGRRDPSIDHIPIDPPFMHCTEMPRYSVTRPIVVSRPALAGDLAIPRDATALALIVHPDSAGRSRPGHRFVADVLLANGVATLSIGLRRPDEESRQAAVTDATVIAERLRGVLDWLTRHDATRGLRFALIAVNDAAAACALAARLPGLEAFETLVLLDGHVALGANEVAAWRRPTLCVAGRHGRPGSAQPLAGARTLRAPHRLVRLPVQTQPQAHPGAYQAMACELVNWLKERVSAGDAAPAGSGRARGDTARNESVSAALIGRVSAFAPSILMREMSIAISTDRFGVKR
jgi:hypothetical protein